MAAIVIVIISRGIFKRPIIPKIKNAAKKFGTTPINDNLIFLNKIQNISEDGTSKERTKQGSIVHPDEGDSAPRMKKKEPSNFTK